MAAKGKSLLAQKLGSKLQKVMEAHKDDEIENVNYGDLPPGVIGVAKLVDVHIGEYKQGDNKDQLFFYAGAVVVAPKMHAGIPVAGMRTSLTEPLCDTPKGGARKTLDEHWKWIRNELGKIAGKEWLSDLDETNLEDKIAELVDPDADPIFIKFSTSSGKPNPKFPNPRTFHNWNGVAEGYDPEEVDGVEEDDDDSEPEETVQVATKPTRGNGKAPTAVAGKTPSRKTPPPPPPEPEDDDEEDDTEDESGDGGEEVEDIDALATAADDEDDEDAKEKLTALALKAGIAKKKVDKADSWATVASWLPKSEPKEDESEDEEDSEAEDEETEQTYSKGDVVFFTPKGKKAKVECEVIKVDEAAKTAVLSELANPTSKHKNVPWDALTPQE
jgi:hypothetical protein